MGLGELQNGKSDVLPLQKKRGEGGKSFSHAEGEGEGGHNKFWGSFNMGA